MRLAAWPLRVEIVARAGALIELPGENVIFVSAPAESNHQITGDQMDNDMYSIALEARVYWAHYRVSVVARDEKRAEWYLRSALKSARRCGEIGARAELELPHMLSDVPRLSGEWSAEFEAVRLKLMTFRTREGLTKWIKEMADEAIVGCGQVYELFEKRFSWMVDSRLDEVEPEYQAMAIEIAKPHGYISAEALDAAWEEVEASGGCSLTGIDPWCCPCGRHE